MKTNQFYKKHTILFAQINANNFYKTYTILFAQINTIVKAGVSYRWDEQCSSQGVGKCVIRISVRGSEGSPAP